jgi:hypothetical protein
MEKEIATLDRNGQPRGSLADRHRGLVHRIRAARLQQQSTVRDLEKTLDRARDLLFDRRLVAYLDDVRALAGIIGESRILIASYKDWAKTARDLSPLSDVATFTGPAVTIFGDPVFVPPAPPRPVGSQPAASRPGPSSPPPPPILN